MIVEMFGDKIITIGQICLQSNCSTILRYGINLDIYDRIRKYLTISGKCSKCIFVEVSFPSAFDKLSRYI